MRCLAGAFLTQPLSGPCAGDHRPAGLPGVHLRRLPQRDAREPVQIRKWVTHGCLLMSPDMMHLLTFLSGQLMPTCLCGNTCAGMCNTCAGMCNTCAGMCNTCAGMCNTCAGNRAPHGMVPTPLLLSMPPPPTPALLPQSLTTSTRAPTAAPSTSWSSSTGEQRRGRACTDIGVLHTSCSLLPCTLALLWQVPAMAPNVDVCMQCSTVTHKVPPHQQRPMQTQQSLPWCMAAADCHHHHAHTHWPSMPPPPPAGPPTAPLCATR
jgi:hypothetical protein